MSRLFSYTIRVDDGAAPNPFRGLCTLAICKPAIRRVADVGDWVVGLGSVNAPSGNLGGHLVYAMRVTRVLTFEEYFHEARKSWPHRIPNINSKDLSERLGDCIYDFSSGQPVQLPSVHGAGNIETDLGGRNVLVSDDFYYFGGRAIPLPDSLKPICHQTQGHRSTANAPFFNSFVNWIRGLNLKTGQLHGWPDFMIDWENIDACGGCTIRAIDDNEDREVC